MNLETVLRRLVQIGSVTDTNPEKGLVRVKLREAGIPSDWLGVVGRELPEIDSTVLVLYLPYEGSAGYVLGVI